MQDVTLDEQKGTVSATVTHFSKYMVVDKKTWFDTWQHKIVYDTEIEDIQTVLAIDCSGSMVTNDPGIYYYNHHETTTYREIAAEKFIDAMRTNGDMASLVMFDSFATAFVHMTNDKEALYDGLSNITSWGGTNFDDVITVSLGEFDESSVASKTIILLTDGEGWVFDSTLKDAVDKGVVIYVIGIGSDINSTVLNRIADYTGGEFYEAKTASEIVDIYSNVQLNQHIDATDTDGDGLADFFETAGMRLPNGNIVYTDPLKWDTDGDGIKDGDEIYIGRYETIDVKINEDGSYEFYYAPSVQFYMLSDPNSNDYDGDGILDKYDRWNDEIWSENNPSDLRYKNLDPMRKNTLETLYPDINNYNNPKNANYITIKDNTIHIRSYVSFSGNVFGYFPNTNLTYAQVIEEGIESCWTTQLYGSEYDFAKGMKIDVVTDVIPIDSVEGGLPRDQQYINIDINDCLGVPITIYARALRFGGIHNPAYPGNIYMYNGDSRGDNPTDYTYNQYKATAAHEFGHTLCLGDAYFENSKGQQLSSNEEVSNGEFCVSGSIMYSDGEVYANDIEMVLEAFVTNIQQDYYTLTRNDEHGDLGKSGVIRLQQNFVYYRYH